MSRSMTSTAVRSAFAPETDQAWIGLLTIAHADLTAPIRICPESVAEDELDGAKGVYSRGEFYAAFPHAIAIPADQEDQPATVRLTVENVSRKVIEAIRSISSPPTVSLEVVLLSDPDTVEAGPWNMTLQSVDYDALTVTGELVHEDILNEPFPGDCFTPNIAPGLF